MKRKFFLFLTLFAFLHAFAENEFKLNDMKVLVLANQTAEIKEYKKATGNYVIPSTVTDPKTKKSYALVSIGKEAFKGCNLTSVTIPATITNIGEGAFKKCKELQTVNWDTEIDEIPTQAFEGCTGLRDFNIRSKTPLIIGERAFYESGLHSISIPGNVTRIRKKAFSYCSDLRQFTIEPGDTPIILEWIFYGTPVNNIKLNRHYESIRAVGEHDANHPFDNNPALTTFVLGEEVSLLPQDVLKGSTGLKKLIIEGDLERFISDNGFDPMLQIMVSLPTNTVYVIGEKEFTAQEAVKQFDTAVSNLKFYELWSNFVETARTNPGAVSNLYSELSPSDFTRNKDRIMADITDLCDNVFLPKQSLTNSEIDCLENFQNNFIQAIMVDYGYSANSNVEAWAKQDILRKDIASNAHKKEYEKLIAITNKTLTHKNANKVYGSMIKLVGLCGLGKWDEAAKYFPTAKSLLTENGRYLEPGALKYIQQVLEEKGYKVGVKTSPKK